MWCPPHIEERHIRGLITEAVLKGGDWFPEVYEILNQFQIAPENRNAFYRHATAVEGQHER